MYYHSTRDKETQYSSAEAIKQGLALDGGLFVPSQIPKVTEEEIARMRKESYAARAQFIMGKFLADYTPEELGEATALAYNKEKFETDTVAPLYKLNNGIYFLELWHGPTCAFKDMALQVLPYLLTKSMEKTFDSHEVVILTATSGDTGKAALDGFKDVPGTKIAVFYPCEGVSNMQKMQMVTQEGKNVMVCGVHGNFDDAQTGVKNIFQNEEYKDVVGKKGHVFSSANSINWGRLVPQIVYYFSAYCDLLENEELEEGESVNFVVPTGNFGNILAAYYAKRMGVPINKLICASNRNNVLTDFIHKGEYNKNREFFATASPSMDILISSNLERLLYDVAGDKDVVEWMNALKENGRYTISDSARDKLAELLWGGCCDDLSTAKTTKETFDEFGYLMDPHTAVGKNVYDQYIGQTGDLTKTVIVSTASPFKFGEFVCGALGCATDDMDDFEVLWQLAEVSGMRMPAALADIADKKMRFEGVCEKDRMLDVVDELFD